MGEQQSSSASVRRNCFVNKGCEGAPRAEPACPRVAGPPSSGCASSRVGTQPHMCAVRCATTPIQPPARAHNTAHTTHQTWSDAVCRAVAGTITRGSRTLSGVAPKAAHPADTAEARCSRRPTGHGRHSTSGAPKRARGSTGGALAATADASVPSAPGNPPKPRGNSGARAAGQLASTLTRGQASAVEPRPATNQNKRGCMKDR